MSERGAWERVAEVAATHFLQTGFDAVSLRHIADELGMKPASLYYHCPGGKAELYERSLAYMMERFKTQLEEATGEAVFPASLMQMADALLDNPPVDFRRIIEVDVPALAKADAALAERVPMLLHAGFFEPIQDALKQAQRDGHVAQGVNVGLLAASVIALVEGLGTMHGGRGDTEGVGRAMVHDALRLLLRGAERGPSKARGTNAGHGSG